MKRKLFFVLSGFVMTLFTSCLDNILCIKGDGVIETERRRTAIFNRIEISTSFEIVYTKKDTAGISINADQNIIDYIVTETAGTTLEIKTSPRDVCFSYSQTPVITISSPDLNTVLISGSGSFLADEMEGDAVTVKLSGSGDINTEHIDCNELTVLLSGSGSITLNDIHCLNSDALISGSGNIYLSGVCENNHIKISGSGNLHTENFITGSASVIISGSGNAFTNIEEKLTGIISGSGNIYVKGDPVIEVTVSGSGRVIKNN
jgi:hypothetical protein